ncbi:uncharacterized protein GLRG_11231 [Colletotrichum graminicola M1.001]|uniref:Uncharacterized protein n=1 Tax=Colletotrichum graminicola (strain M1.001 / M2 / FGSC 10212) TaxID=645133 RepID=E3QYZ9_COLGM|nr:uncharacterized protein GLRG_11231 [Colletotrichum graminicola M1.001]EFQ36087.1 hypothetical protein GLRG_11231 [Colletotrichum graminicola M1.001]
MDPINLPAIQPCVCPAQHLKVHFQNRPVQAPTDLPWAPALHIALAHRQLDTAALLVDWGADRATGQHGTHGITALMVASANALLPFLDHLLDSDQAFRHSSHFHPATINWEDSFSISMKDYTMAVLWEPELSVLNLAK